MKPPSEFRAAAFVLLPSVCQPGVPPAGSNFPTTFGSRSKKDCDLDLSRTLQSTRRQLPPLLGLPSPACMLPIRHASQYKTVSLCSQKFYPIRVAPTTLLDKGAPFRHPHYKSFNTSTGTSPPVPRIGTLALAGAVCLSFSLRIGMTGSYVPH